MGNIHYALWAKLDNTGELIKSKIFNHQHTEATSIIHTLDGGLALAGIDGRDALLAKLAADGSTLQGCDNMQAIHLTTKPLSLIEDRIQTNYHAINLNVTDQAISTRKIFPIQRNTCKSTPTTSTTSYPNKPSNASIALFIIGRYCY